jgi:hypothetical protein
MDFSETVQFIYESIKIYLYILFRVPKILMFDVEGVDSAEHKGDLV